MRPILPAAATALSLACATPALAAPDAVTVSFADLNLASSAGAETLVRRVDAAALRLCGSRPDIKAIAAWQQFQQCRLDARTRALAGLDLNRSTMARR